MNKLLEQQNKETYSLLTLAPFISRGIAPKYVENQGLSVLNQKCIRDWKVSYDQSRLTFNSDSVSSKLLKENDILICSTGVGTLGRVAQLNKIERPTTVDSHVSIVRPDFSKVNPIFLGYVLKKSEKIIESLAEGSTGQTELPRTKLQELEIGLPSRAFQDQAVGILSTYDAKIDNNNVIIKNLETIAQTIFNEWFTKYHFPGWEKVRWINSELGEIPEGWRVGNIDDLTQRLSVQNMYKEDELSSEGLIPVYDQSSKGIIGYHNESPTFKATPDQPILIFGDHTCRTQLVCEPFSLGPNTIPLSGKNNINSVFTFFAIRGKIKQREYKRHWNELINVNLIIPDVDTVNIFSDRVKPLIKEMYLRDKENLLLNKCRNRLIAKLV